MSQLKIPKQKDDQLLEDIRKSFSKKEGVRLWWLGQSGFLLQYNGKHLLIDPYLSDSLTKKYAQTDKPHVRMTERVIDPARLDFIDIVTSSHNHTDHLDGETLIPLIHNNPGITMVIPEANRAFVSRRTGRDADFPVGLDNGKSYEQDGFKITAIPSAHEELETDSEGRFIYLGYLISVGGLMIYHCGDTLWYKGLEDILDSWSIDVAILPINGRKAARRVAGNLNGREAAFLGKTIGAGVVIPCHYDMFKFNTANPLDFAKKADAIGQKYKILENGEGWEVNLNI